MANKLTKMIVEGRRNSYFFSSLNQQFELDAFITLHYSVSFNDVPFAVCSLATVNYFFNFSSKILAKIRLSGNFFDPFSFNRTSKKNR